MLVEILLRQEEEEVPVLQVHLLKRVGSLILLLSRMVGNIILPTP